MANEEDNDSFSLISLILRLGAWYTIDITQVEKKPTVSRCLLSIKVKVIHREELH